MSIVLNVVTAEGRQLPIHVAENDTLATVRSKVYSTHGFSLTDRDLYFNAVRYSDTYDLATIGAAYNGAIMGASVPKTNLSVNVNATSFGSNMHSPVSVSVSPQMNVNVPIMSSPLQQPFRRFSDTQPTVPTPVMSVPLTPVTVTPTMLPLTLPNTNMVTPVLISPTSIPEPRRFSDTATAPVFYRTSITQTMYPPYSPQSASTPTSATSLATSSPSFHTTSTASPSSHSFHPMMMSSPSPTSTTSTSSTNTISPANSDKLQDKRPSFKRLQSNNPFEQVEATLELAESHPINETLYEKSKDSIPDAAIATPPTPESRFKLLRAATIPSNIQVNVGTTTQGPPSPAHQRTSSNNTTASPKLQGHGLPPKGRHKKGLSVAFDLALTAYEHDKLASEAEITQLTSKLKELQSQSSEITKNHTDDVETMEEQVKKLRLELEKTVTERDLKMAKYKHDIGELQNQYHTSNNELTREQTRSKEILANAVQQQMDWEMKIQTVTAALIHTQEETRVEKVKHDEVMNALTSKYATLSCKRDTEHWEREQSQQKLMAAIYQVLSDHGLVNDVYKYMKYRDSLERETKETDITVIERNLTKKLQQTTVNPVNTAV